jgi:FKBP-type peptidyl-prolyl cis-trans isomerase FklB
MRIITIFSLLIFAIACDNEKSGKPANIANEGSKSSLEAPLNNKKDSLSYALGQQIGAIYLKDSIDINLESFYAGVNDGYKRIPNQISSAAIRQIVTQFQAEDRAKKEKEFQSKVNMIEQQSQSLPKLTKQILEENKSKPGVTITESGLQYRIVNPGRVEKFEDGLIVKMHAIIMNVDSTVVVDSRSMGQPNYIPYELLQVGFREAVNLAGIGGEIDLLITPDLAFGQVGMVLEPGNPASPSVPANSAVFSKLEIVDIITKEEAEAEGIKVPTKEEMEELDFDNIPAGEPRVK